MGLHWHRGKIYHLYWIFKLLICKIFLKKQPTNQWSYFFISWRLWKIKKKKKNNTGKGVFCALWLWLLLSVCLQWDAINLFRSRINSALFTVRYLKVTLCNSELRCTSIFQKYSETSRNLHSFQREYSILMTVLLRTCNVTFRDSFHGWIRVTVHWKTSSLSFCDTLE